MMWRNAACGMRKSAGLSNGRDLILHSTARNPHVPFWAILPKAHGGQPGVAFQETRQQAMSNINPTPLHVSFAAAVFALCVTAATAQTAVPLNKEPHINQSLVAVAVGNAIRKTCPSISARMLVALSKGRDLQKYALDKGYTKAQMDAFLDDGTEKSRVKALAADYMAANGVVKGDTESYCRLGRAEIAKNSLTGSLLKE